MPADALHPVRITYRNDGICKLLGSKVQMIDGSPFIDDQF
jgi:hypothetical protein